MFTGDDPNETMVANPNKLEFTMAVKTKFGDIVNIDIQDLQKILDRVSDWYSMQLGW